MSESIDHFHGLNMKDEQIIIYMPRHLNEMMARYTSPVNDIQHRMTSFNRFKGILVVNGYEPKIIVAAVEGTLFNIEHKQMQTK